jgi:hypothetical protein
VFLGAHVDLEIRKLIFLDVSEQKYSSLKTDADREQGESIRASLTVLSNSDGSGKANRNVKPNTLSMFSLPRVKILWVTNIITETKRSGW